MGEVSREPSPPFTVADLDKLLIKLAVLREETIAEREVLAGNEKPNQDRPHGRSGISKKLQEVIQDTLERSQDLHEIVARLDSLERNTRQEDEDLRKELQRSQNEIDIL